MNILTLAWRNIISNPLNLLMSIILFGLGVGLISFLLLFNTQLKDKFDKNLAEIDLVVGAKGSPLQMILCNMYHIDNPTGNIPIKNAAPLLKDLHPLIKKAIPLSLGDNYKSYRIVGSNHDIVELYGGKLKEGQLWKKDLEVTIGKSVADETGLKIGDTFSSAHGFVEDDHVHSQLQVFWKVRVLSWINLSSPTRHLSGKSTKVMVMKLKPMITPTKGKNMTMLMETITLMMMVISMTIVIRTYFTIWTRKSLLC